MTKVNRPNWKKFEEHTKEILKLCGLQPDTNLNKMGRQTDIWCKASESLVSARIIIECKSTKVETTTVPVSEVTDFCARLSLARSSGVADQGWLVTNGQFSSNASTVIREAHLDGVCKLFTFESLLSSIVDFSSYFAQVRLSIPKNKLGFIDPSVTVISKRMTKKFDSFLDCCSYWISDDAPEVMLLLGDYGQGKTTCCQQLLESYLTDKNLVLDRVPLYIRLRDVANQGYQLPAILRVCLQEQFGLNYHSFQLIQYLAGAGRLIFIFDGLDEVSYTGFWNDIFPPLRQILSISSRKNKILITSRPGVFSSEESVSMTLDSLLPEDDKTRSMTVQVDYFDRNRVTDAIQQYGFDNPKKMAAQLYANNGIADLIRRPITLQMILESLASEEIAFKSISSSTSLYKSYTNAWLHRDSWRSNIQHLSLQKGNDFKIEFVQQLAWNMLTSRLPRVSSDYIDDAVREYFTQIKGVTELLPAFANEIRLCSFLDWRLDGSLVFSHKSFLDYFVAKHLSTLSVDEKIRELSRNIFDRTTLTFAAQLLGWQEIRKTDLYDKQIRVSSILCLNTIHILALLKEKLSLTATFVNGYQNPPNSGEFSLGDLTNLNSN